MLKKNIIIFMFSTLLALTACGHSVTTQNPSYPTAVSQIDTVMTESKGDTKSYKTTDMTSVKEGLRDGWGNSVVENENSVFHIALDGSVIKTDKASSQSEIIIPTDFENDYDTDAIFLNDNFLYRLHENVIYRYDLKDLSEEKLIAFDEITGGLTHSAYWGFSGGIYVYNGAIYVNMDMDIYQIDIKNKCLNLIAELNNAPPCFKDNYLYFTDHTNHFALYRYNLDTNQTERVRGEEYDMELEKQYPFVIYYNPFIFKDDIYYMKCILESEDSDRIYELYKYCGDEKDVLIYNDSFIATAFSDEKHIFIQNYDHILILNDNYSITETIQTPKKCYEICTAVDNHLYFEYTNEKNYLGVIDY